MTDTLKSISYRSLFIAFVLLAVYGNTITHGFLGACRT